VATPDFIQVAPDGGGKKMRTEIDQVIQPDGTTVDVHREIVSGPPEWQETLREQYMRRLAEDTLAATQQMVNLLAAQAGRTSPYGGSIP